MVFHRNMYINICSEMHSRFMKQGAYYQDTVVGEGSVTKTIEELSWGNMKLPSKVMVSPARCLSGPSAS
jgi:hypothetical protein